MSFEQKDFTGALFANDKGGNEKRPDCRGKAMVNGVEYQMSGWWRVAKGSGKKYLSVVFDVPYEKDKIPSSSAADYRAAKEGTRRVTAELDDDLPF